MVKGLMEENVCGNSTLCPHGLNGQMNRRWMGLAVCRIFLDDLAPAGGANSIQVFEGVNMRKATKTVATWLGIAAGIAGLENGYFEILQGYTRPEGLMIASMGPPCDPEVVWNACEPAMTILPQKYHGVWYGVNINHAAALRLFGLCL
jgi:hypothetical protein